MIDTPAQTSRRHDRDGRSAPVRSRRQSCQGKPTRPPHFNLALGMIKGAAKDLDRSPGHRRETALQWIRSDSEKVLSARWCCAVIGVSIHRLREYANDLVDSE